MELGATCARVQLRHTMTTRSLPIQELREPLLSVLGRQRRMILTASTRPVESVLIYQARAELSGRISSVKL